MYSYINGNAFVNITEDGTRFVESLDEKLDLEFPLNIDIRVSTRCSFGQKPDGTFVLCSFCHESAKTDGTECDYSLLKSKLKDLPKGIELAIGCNEFTEGLRDFLLWAKEKDYICNLTINQGHINRDFDKILIALQNKIIYGLGISYRSSLPFKIPSELLDYDNTVFHCIAGIDTVDDILELKNKGTKKLLILGEKNFGFNLDNVYQQDINPWVYRLGSILKTFDLVSFDNLAVQQLDVRRFFLNKDKYDTFYQGEHSMYIDAANGIFSPSSRSLYKKSWDNISVKSFYNKIKNMKEI